MIRFIKSMLSENGDISSGRTVLLLLVIIILCKYVSFNVVAVLHGTPPVPFDAQDIGILSVALGSKITQAIFAEKEPKDK